MFSMQPRLPPLWSGCGGRLPPLWCGCGCGGRPMEKRLPPPLGCGCGCGCGGRLSLSFSPVVWVWVWWPPQVRIPRPPLWNLVWRWGAIRNIENSSGGRCETCKIIVKTKVFSSFSVCASPALPCGSWVGVGGLSQILKKHFLQHFQRVHPSPPRWTLRGTSKIIEKPTLSKCFDAFH